MNLNKKIFADWKTWELIYLLGACLSLTICTIIFKSWVLSLFSSITGIFGVLLNKKNNRFCFIFYCLSSITYAVVAYTQKFYGECIIQAVYLFPLYFVTIIKSLRNNSIKINNTKIESLTKKMFILLGLLTIVIITCYGLFLSLLKSNYPFLNSLSTALCIIAAFLTAKHYKEQWFIWILSNTTLLTLWFLSTNLSTDGIPFLIQNGLYLIINIIGLISWNKIYKNELMEK